MKNSIIKRFLFLVFFFLSTEVYSKDFIIEGNKYTDDDIVISIIDQIPDTDIKSQSNFILDILSRNARYCIYSS